MRARICLGARRLQLTCMRRVPRSLRSRLKRRLRKRTAKRSRSLMTTWDHSQSTTISPELARGSHVYFLCKHRCSMHQTSLSFEYTFFQSIELNTKERLALPTQIGAWASLWCRALAHGVLLIFAICRFRRGCHLHSVAESM